MWFGFGIFWSLGGVRDIGLECLFLNGVKRIRADPVWAIRRYQYLSI